MYSTRKEIKQFQMAEAADIAGLNEIINNPLCTVVRRHNYILTETIYDPKSGRPLRSIQIPWCEIEYLEKVLDE